MRFIRVRLISCIPQPFFGLAPVALLRRTAYSFLASSAFLCSSSLLGFLASQALGFILSATAFLRCPAVSFLSLSALLCLTPPLFRFLFLSFEASIVVNSRTLVTENLIRLVDFLEPLLGVRGIPAVWMKLQSQPAIRPADVIVGGVSVQSEDFVVVA